MVEKISFGYVARGCWEAECNMYRDSQEGVVFCWLSYLSVSLYKFVILSLFWIFTSHNCLIESAPHHAIEKRADRNWTSGDVTPDNHFWKESKACVTSSAGDSIGRWPQPMLLLLMLMLMSLHSWKEEPLILWLNGRQGASEEGLMVLILGKLCNIHPSNE